MLDAGEPLDLLHRLVDASLLVADPATGRFRLLFTVRTFLLDEVARLGETESVHARFVRRCVVVAEEIHDRMLGPDEGTVDRRLRDELANLRAARDLGDADAKVTITLAVNFAVTWRDLREIWAWADELETDPSLTAHRRRPAILAAAAEAARLVGDFDRAERLAREAMATAESDPDTLGRARSVLAVVAHFRGDFDAARGHWLRAAEDCQFDASAFVGSAALATLYGGDGAQARVLLDQAAAMATCGSHEAFVAYVEGELCMGADPRASIPCYLDAIATAGSRRLQLRRRCRSGVLGDRARPYGRCCRGGGRLLVPHRVLEAHRSNNAAMDDREERSGAPRWRRPSSSWPPCSSRPPTPRPALRRSVRRSPDTAGGHGRR